MPRRVASFTPLPVWWPHPPGPLSRGVSVVERPVFDESEWKKMFNMRGSEETTILKTVHWLCIESPCEPPHNEHSLWQVLAADLRSAMLAFQIWAPKGWTGIIVNTTITDGGPIRVLTVSFPEHYALTRWAQRISVDDLSTAELKTIIDGTLWALGSGLGFDSGDQALPVPGNRIANGGQSREGRCPPVDDWT